MGSAVKTLFAYILFPSYPMLSPHRLSQTQSHLPAQFSIESAVVKPARAAKTAKQKQRSDPLFGRFPYRDVIWVCLGAKIGVSDEDEDDESEEEAELEEEEKELKEKSVDAMDIDEAPAPPKPQKTPTKKKPEPAKPKAHEKSTKQELSPAKKKEATPVKKAQSPKKSGQKDETPKKPSPSKRKLELSVRHLSSLTLPSFSHLVFARLKSRRPRN